VSLSKFDNLHMTQAHSVFEDNSWIHGKIMSATFLPNVYKRSFLILSTFFLRFDVFFTFVGTLMTSMVNTLNRS